MKNIKLKLLLTLLIVFSYTFLFSINSTKAIYRETKGTTINLSIVSDNTYQVILNSHGGDIGTITRNITPNSVVGQLPIPEKANNNFIGWFTEASGGREINSYEVITSNITFHAHWQKVVCIKATSGTLHEEECQTTGSCISSGYSNGQTITYGTIYGQNQTKPVSGNAYNCDVDNDDDYNEVVNGKNTERFYFIRENNNETMVLIYHTSIDENGPVDTQELLTNPTDPDKPYYQGGSYYYDEAVGYLPTSSTWTNPDLESFNGKKARFLNLEDLEDACGTLAIGSSGYLNTCQYLMENSRFQNKNKGRAGIWVERNGDTAGSNNGYRLHTETRTLANGINTNTGGSQNTSRPVIEVPLVAFEGYEYRELYEVSFVTNGGSTISSIYRRANEPIGSLLSLAPTRENYTFAGWYADAYLTTPVSDSMIITGNTKVYAKWIAESLQYVFHIPGTCTFHGAPNNNGDNYITSSSNDCISTINPTGQNIDYTLTTPKKNYYIDTGISLFSNDNYSKEFEVGFTIDSYTYNASGQHNQATFINSKLENSSLSYPGFVVRKQSSTINLTEKFEGVEASNSFTYTPGMSLKIVRKNDKIYYAQGNNALTELQDISAFAHQFNLHAWFGAIATESNVEVDGTTSSADRYLIGTLSNMYIKLEVALEHFVTFNPNNGGNTESFTVSHGSIIGANMPSNPTKNGYYFVGWYDGQDFITSSTEVLNDIHAEAIWVQSITNGTITPNPMAIAIGSSEQISISGTDLEDVTYTSNDTNIATVDSTGLVTAVTAGSTTITITGTKSNDTVSVTVNVSAPQVNVTFEPNNGDSQTIVTITAGNTLNSSQIPTGLTKPDYVFAGWFINGQTMLPFDDTITVTANITVEALWKPSLSLATVSPSSLSIVEGTNGQITVSGPNGMETYSFTSNDPTIATVSSSGVVTGVSQGSTTITITGDESEYDTTVTVTVTEATVFYTVTFETNGANETINPIQVTAGGTLGVNMPSDPTKADNIFSGWYDSTFTNVMDANTVINGNVTFYAKWIPSNAVAEMNGSYYTTVQLALNAAPYGNTAAEAPQTTIKLLKDITVTSDYIADMYTLTNNNNNTQKNIILDFQGHTITNGNNNRYILRTRGITEIKNGTIKTQGSKGAVEANAGGTLIVNNMRIEATGTRQGVYNEAGTVVIKGGSYITAKAAVDSSNKRATVQNLGGTLSILDAEIISPTGLAVGISGGVVTIGTQDNEYDTDSIVIQGLINGIYSTQNYYLYDGLVKGRDESVNDITKITTETNAIKHDSDTEIISSETYKLLYYTMPVTSSTIASATIDSVVTVPLGSTKTINVTGPSNMETYTFTSNNTNIVTVNSSGVITPVSEGMTTITITGDDSNITRTVDVRVGDVNGVVTFRTTNDAMKVYYSNISTWKNSSSNFPSWSDSNKSPNWSQDATENTVMKQNFDNYNCACTDNQCSGGSVECDKPNGYFVGYNETLNVYLYNVSNSTRGAKVNYAKATNGTIYNLIPDQVYEWELVSDNTVTGLVKFTGERRILNTGDVRNTRDLGGLPVDTDGNGTIDGHLEYGRLIRGIKLNSSSSVTELTNLGLNSELDLREANTDTNKISRYQRIEAQNYYINPFTTTNPSHTPNATELNYYNMTRDAVTSAMQEIVAGRNLYFHCRIGADRTGSVAYILEGLLGVPEEDRIQDYELSFFSGLVRVHRYHNYKPGSSVGTGYERFVYMHDFMPSNQLIYNWYMAGTSNQSADEALINSFRAAMINNN